MSTILPLLDRNKGFATTNATSHVPKIPFIPNQLAFVVTCIDPRTDPANFLSLELGDAIVLRSLGGRVTPAVLQEIAYISYLLEHKAPGGPYFELAVIHHNDCGTGFLADEALRHDFAERGGYNEQELADLPVLDPARTVRTDVERLVSAPQVWSKIKVSGYTYDVHTGLVTTVVELTPATGH